MTEKPRKPASTSPQTCPTGPESWPGARSKRPPGAGADLSNDVLEEAAKRKNNLNVERARVSDKTPETSQGSRGSSGSSNSSVRGVESESERAFFFFFLVLRRGKMSKPPCGFHSCLRSSLSPSRATRGKAAICAEDGKVTPSVCLPVCCWSGPAWHPPTHSPTPEPPSWTRPPCTGRSTAVRASKVITFGHIYEHVQD